MTYLIVTISISDQKTSDRDAQNVTSLIGTGWCAPPKTSFSFTERARSDIAVGPRPARRARRSLALPVLRGMPFHGNGVPGAAGVPRFWCATLGINAGFYPRRGCVVRRFDEEGPGRNPPPGTNGNVRPS